MSKPLFTYDNLVHAVSGAVGSMVGTVVFYPLDTVRCRLQLEDRRRPKNTLFVIKELIEEEGVSTLYRGIVPFLQSLCASNFVYFYVYHGLKNSLGQNHSHLLMATIAGAVNVMITSPLWLVNTRMKMAGITEAKKYNNLIDGLIKIAKTEGCGTLWSGTIPSLILVSNPAIHMAVYEYLKRRAKKNTALSYFILSAMAKVTATVFTYPIQLAQAKQRHGQSSLRDMKTRIGMIQILIYIIRKDGASGLFKGMEAKLLQTVLTTALMFMCYEKISSTVFRIMK